MPILCVPIKVPKTNIIIGIMQVVNKKGLDVLLDDRHKNKSDKNVP